MTADAAQQQRRVVAGLSASIVLPNVSTLVPGRSLVLDVRDVDGDSPRGLLGCAVDLVERHVTAHARVREDLRDGSDESGLPVVDVSHRADVEVRLVADVRLLSHDWLLLVPPAALADPRALTAPRDAPPSPAGSGKRTGKGQRRTPSRASRPADDSSAEDSSAEAAVIAARSNARATKTANRNTPASVQHQPPRPQRVFGAFFPRARVRVTLPSSPARTKASSILENISESRPGGNCGYHSERLLVPLAPNHYFSGPGGAPVAAGAPRAVVAHKSCPERTRLRLAAPVSPGARQSPVGLLRPRASYFA